MASSRGRALPGSCEPGLQQLPDAPRPSPTPTPGLPSPLSSPLCPAPYPTRPKQGWWLAAAQRWIEICLATSHGDLDAAWQLAVRPNGAWRQMLPRDCPVRPPPPSPVPPSHAPSQFSGTASLRKALLLPGKWRPHDYIMGGLRVSPGFWLERKNSKLQECCFI